MESFVVGIDAGGTHIRVQFADAATGLLSGKPLVFKASASGAPPQDLLLPSRPVTAVCAGITKITRAGISDAWKTFLQKQFPQAIVAIVPDYEIAFHAAIPHSNGVLIIAGTGSVAYGENQESGTTLRVGGRGWEWGDEGSGAWLTIEMVRRTLRALDGQAEATALTIAVCRELQTNEPATLAGLARSRSQEDGGAGRGFLIPLLHQLLQEDNEEATGLFVGAGGWLSALARTAANRLAFSTDKTVTFGTVGGVWDAGGKTVRQAFTNALTRHYTKANVLFDVPAPSVGAVQQAFVSQGIRSK